MDLATRRNSISRRETPVLKSFELNMESLVLVSVGTR
jgi:hypothetical protein